MHYYAVFLGQAINVSDIKNVIKNVFGDIQGIIYSNCWDR